MKFAGVMRSAVAGSAILLAQALAAHAQEVNVYTTREPGLIQPLFDAFTAETGIAVNAILVQQGLAERLEAEGANSPADVAIVVDYGGLVDLKARGLTQAIESATLNEVVPESLRDPEGHWYALSLRARVIYVSVDRVTDATLTYEDLADERFDGRVCIRSGQHPYNTSLFAAMIVKDGLEATAAYMTALAGNLARTAGGGDRDVARDILADICDVGIANSYYVGLMRSGAGGVEQQQWGAAIRVILPTFADGAGTHVNISGAAVTANAPNRDNAIALLDFMVSDAAQDIYARSNYEYPVKVGAPIDPIIAELGTLVIDPTPLAEVAAHRGEVSELVDRIGFDQPR